MSALAFLPAAVRVPPLQQAPLRRPEMRLVGARPEPVAALPETVRQRATHEPTCDPDEDSERWDGLG